MILLTHIKLHLQKERRLNYCPKHVMPLRPQIRSQSPELHVSALSRSITTAHEKSDIIFVFVLVFRG